MKCGVLLLLAAMAPAQDWGRRSPRVISRTEPTYSEEARRAGVNTNIKLTLIVNQRGLPENIRVMRGAGFGLDEIAIHTVKTWRFEPGSQAGRDTSSPVEIELNFRIADRGHAAQTARLNFDLPSGVERPVLIEGKIPPTPVRMDDGLINMRLTVRADGTAGDCKTLQSDDAKWEAQVREAMSHWRFRPATRDGHAEEVNGIFELSVSRPVIVDGPRHDVVKIWRREPEDTSLPAPQLIAPTDRAVFEGLPRRVPCKWESSAGALSYLLEWDYLSREVWHAEDQGLPGTAFLVNGTEFTFDFVGAQAGRWRVWPINNSGRRGNPSEWRTFRYAN